MKDTDYFSIWERVGYEGKKQENIDKGVTFILCNLMCVH